MKEQEQKRGKTRKHEQLKSSYHGRPTLLAVWFLAEPQSVCQLQLGNGVRPVAHLLLGQVEGGGPSGVVMAGHIAHPVALSLKRLHSAVNEAGYKVGRLQPLFLVHFTHPIDHPIQIGIPVADSDSPVVLRSRRGQRKFWQVVAVALVI